MGHLKETVEFETVFCFPGRRASGQEQRAETVPHVAKGNCVVDMEGQRFVEPQTGGQFPVVAVDVRRAPVVSDRQVKALGLLSVRAPQKSWPANCPARTITRSSSHRFSNHQESRRKVFAPASSLGVVISPR
jgi:hypothetical protein